MMNFHIQDTSYSNSYSLHEALVKACHDAIYGGGAYAFVTKGGANLLLGDQSFSNLISNGTFRLIAGMDEVTDEQAVNKMGEFVTAYKGNLTVEAFLHPNKSSLFHPKFSWFKNNRGGVLVVGSGNLTEGGLRRNREAFAFMEVDVVAIEEIERQWDDWLKHNEVNLVALIDPRVVGKAKQNAKMFNRTKQLLGDFEDVADVQEPEAGLIKTNYDVDLDAWSFSEDDSVLVAEIPKSKNRWKQANFNKANFESFFGARAGENGHHRILLRNVTESGTLSETEVRPTVSVASQNYGVELAAASGKEYPAGGRPIGVFVRVSTRMFLYVLLMPGDASYGGVLQFLKEASGSQSSVRRYVTSVHELKQACGKLMIWRYVI